MSKISTVKSCFNFTEGRRVVRLNIKTSRKNVWHLDQNNLHAFECHWASPSDVLAIYFRTYC